MLQSRPQVSWFRSLHNRLQWADLVTSRTNKFENKQSEISTICCVLTPNSLSVMFIANNKNDLG
jgi:hypothetical protein